MNPTDLEAVVARTGHERYRFLTSDANLDAESREGYRRIVREIAAGRPPTAPQAAPEAPAGPMASWRRERLLGVRACFYAGEPTCSCSGSAYCHALGRDVTLGDCRECLR